MVFNPVNRQHGNKTVQTKFGSMVVKKAPTVLIHKIIVMNMFLRDLDEFMNLWV